MAGIFERSQRPLRRGEFYAQWRLERDVQRAARAGGALCVAVWAAIRARAGTRAHLAGSFAPSLDTLAGDLGMSRRSVQAQLRALESAGLLRVDRPTGRKPVFVLLLGETDPGTTCQGVGFHLGTTCQGQPVEISGGPWHQVPGTLAPRAEDPGTTCTPVPPQESRERRERKAVGDDELRKKRFEQGTASEIEALVHRFADAMSRLLDEQPGSPTHEALEELVEEARDVSAWRLLVEQAESALALSPHLAEADA